MDTPCIVEPLPRPRARRSLPAETDLVERAQAGDRVALTQLLRRHASAIERICRGLCCDPNVLDDLIQETYVGIIRALPTYRGDACFLTWVYMIARTHRGRAWRSFHRERRRAESLVAAAPMLPRAVPAPDEVATPAEVRGTLSRAFHSLDPVNVELMLLSVAGYGAGDLAEAMGMSIPAVKTRLHRARRRARAQRMTG